MTTPVPSKQPRFIDPNLTKLKTHLVSQVTSELSQAPASSVERETAIKQCLLRVYTQMGLKLPDSMRLQLFHEILDDLLGYGPIQSFLDDPEVTEVMVNGPQNVYIEIKGQIILTNVTFDNDDHVMRIIDKIIAPLGRHVDASNPMVDARLPDGSRVNAVVRPTAIDGPSITIRKFSEERFTIDRLIEFESLTRPVADFLRACVLSRLNIIVSGGTGSGKTTLLNVLSGNIPDSERIVTIEDTAELRLSQRHVVRLEARLPDVEGQNEVTIRQLVRNALRMRPDRIVVGECRGPEALDMLQAMNTGHDGSMTTLHANKPRDALSRLETMVLMAGITLPLNVIRQQIASAVDLIVQVSRLRGGQRKVVSVNEVAGMEGDIIVMTDIFKFEQTGVSEDGKVLGALKPTGIRPMFDSRIETAGYKLDASIFRTQRTPPQPAGVNNRR
jgi:pilus assembly protein CpaF